MSRLIVIDLETTGLYPEQGDTILEIAALPIVHDTILFTQAFVQLVNPEKKIPSHITEINHITDQMVQDEKPLREVLPQFLDYVQDFPLVAHNAPFDMGFLHYFTQKLNLRRLTNRVVDTMDLSKEFFPYCSHHNLDALLSRLGIPYDKRRRHRSLDDVHLTALAFIKMRSIL